jgi:hypothetical protein
MVVCKQPNISELQKLEMLAQINFSAKSLPLCPLSPCRGHDCRMVKQNIYEKSEKGSKLKQAHFGAL